MLRFPGRLLAAVSLSSIALLQTTAWAQEASASAGEVSSTAEDAQDARGVQDIVVTAQKRSESVNDVPMSITAIGGDDLIRQGVNSAADLVKVVPGFNYTPSAYNAPVYTLRGIGFQEGSLAASPAVTVYVDEVPIPFPAMTLGAAFDLDRVEVLKGPQGTLFGQNSTGGAINYVAAKPGDTFEAGADFSYGRFNLFEGSGYVSGPLADTLHARLAVKTIQGGEWQRSYTRDDKLGNKDQLVGRFLLDWAPSDRVNFSLNVNGWRDKSDSQAVQLIAPRPQNPASPNAAAINAYPLAPENARAADWDAGRDFVHDDWYYQVSLRGDIELSDALTLTSLSAYQKFRQNVLQDRDGMDLHSLAVRSLGSAKSFSQELRLSGDMDGIKWVVGANYQDDRVNDNFALDYSDSTVNPTLGIPINSNINFAATKIKTAAVFANFEWEIADRLKLSGGVRYTDVRRRFGGCTLDNGNGEMAALYTLLSSTFRGTPTPPIAPGECGTLDSTTFLPGLVTSRLNEDNISWKGGISYEPNSDLLFYANVGRGYKAGGFPTLSATVSSQFAPVTQESVTSYEAGFKATVLDRTAQLNGAVFYYDYKNKQIRGQVPDAIFGNFEALVNIPKSRIFGVELQASIVPVEGFKTDVGVSYVDSKITDSFINYTPLVQLGDFEGEPFPYTPKWQISINSEYRFPVSSSLEAFVGGGITYQSETNGGFGQLRIVDVDNYALLDARAGVAAEDGRWTFSIWGRNLTNKYYWTNASVLNDAAFRFAGMPVTYGASLSIRI